MATATTPRSLSRSANLQEFKQVLLQRLQSLKSIPAQNGLPTVCSVYAGAGTQAFEAGESSVYKLRTNLVHNKVGLLSFVQSFLAENAAATDMRTLAEKYYEMERRFVVQANVWVDNPSLGKILSFGNAHEAVMGLLTEEQFTVKDTGELVTTYRLNQVTWNGVQTHKGSSIDSDLAAIFQVAPEASKLAMDFGLDPLEEMVLSEPTPPPPAAPAPPPAAAAPANWKAPNGQVYAEAALTGSGWTPETLMANGYTKA